MACSDVGGNSLKDRELVVQTDFHEDSVWLSNGFGKRQKCTNPSWIAKCDIHEMAHLGFKGKFNIKQSRLENCLKRKHRDVNIILEPVD